MSISPIIFYTEIQILLLLRPMYNTNSSTEISELYHCNQRRTEAIKSILYQFENPKKFPKELQLTSDSGVWGINRTIYMTKCNVNEKEQHFLAGGSC